MSVIDCYHGRYQETLWCVIKFLWCELWFVTACDKSFSTVISMVNSGFNFRIMASGSESWKECANWLTRCDVLRQDHKANWPEASCSDLAYTLRDGVLLCNLLTTLDPGCIDMKDINQKPQMAQVGQSKQRKFLRRYTFVLKVIVYKS